MQFDFFLAVIAVVIILVLAFYAGILLNKIKMQNTQNKHNKAQQKAKEQQRNDNICESIRLIARATENKQCNLSEAAIRLTILLETLQLEAPVNIDKEYPALAELFHNVKEMPTHDRRKEIPIKELKKLDKQRQVFEAKLEDKIIIEASRLANFSL